MGYKQKYWGLELDRQVMILDAALDPRIRTVANMLLFKPHPEGRFEEADITAAVAQDHQLQPEDMPDVFEKHAGLVNQGLLKSIRR